MVDGLAAVRVDRFRKLLPVPGAAGRVADELPCCALFCGHFAVESSDDEVVISMMYEL